MGILAPLFLAGLAGLSLPLIFHLVRRQPRGKQDFSSLMFLTPTPPRLTRRSRLDQVLLLLLRLAALILLALAFARPFWREASLLSLADLPRQKVAILIDNSASMQRGDLWKQAIAQAETELAGLAPQDDVALFTFAERLTSVVPFKTPDKQTTAASSEIVKQSLGQLRCTWGTSDLGAALASVASELDAGGDVEQSTVQPRLIVISDFQKGSRVDALQGFEWPKNVQVVQRSLEPKQTTNATLQLLVDETASADDAPRVRVVNAANSAGDQFFVRWSGATPSETKTETAIYVPPGQSRVVRLPRPTNPLLFDRVVLRGDDQEFDNTFYIVPPRQQQVQLVYAGDDAENDAHGLQYFLRIAAGDDPLREITYLTPEKDSKLLPGKEAVPQLVVVTRGVSQPQADELRAYVAQGGVLVLAPIDLKSEESLASVLPGVSLREQQPATGENHFRLLGEIDFTHPLFAPLAGPRYNDFTRIHFWNHRAVDIASETKDLHVVARFDNGDPWLIEQTQGKGRVFAFTSTWQTEDSQLAVSTKFVPLIGSLLDLACGSTAPQAGVLVGAAIELPDTLAPPRVVTLPAGESSQLADDSQSFTGTSQPGIYSIGDLRFAVNLAPSESDTAPLASDQLEQLGVRLGPEVTRSEELANMRQQRDTELESRQQLWRWLLVACIGILIMESWWAGHAARQSVASTEAIA